MKQWHAETVSGSAKDLEQTLQRIEDASGNVVGVTTFSGTSSGKQYKLPVPGSGKVSYHCKHDHCRHCAMLSCTCPCHTRGTK